MLENITKVEVPEFLFTRILQKIHQLEKESYSINQIVFITSALVLILCINVLLVAQKRTFYKTEISLVDSFDLTPSNSLYFE